MATIFIVGYMACGKTTFGRALAEALGYEFIDLDFYIEQRFRKPVRQIFAEHGENEFRRMEAVMLREAGEFEDVVVACGGGTPCHNDNMEYMNSRGLTVWLQASVERTVERLLRAVGKRPITAGIPAEELPSFVESHLAERKSYYSKAKVSFGSEFLENRREISESVRKFISTCLQA